VVCSICGKSNLDREKCSQPGGHNLAVRDISDPTTLHDLNTISGEAFDKMVRQFLIKDSELSLIGLQREISVPIENTSRMTAEKYIETLEGDQIYEQFLSTAYSNDVSVRLKEIEELERETFKEMNKKKAEYRATHEKTEGFNESFKQYAKRLVAEFPDSARFSTHVDAGLSDLIIGGRVLRDAPAFVAFIRRMKDCLFSRVLEIPSYEQYISSMIGLVTVDEVGEVYADFFLDVLHGFTREPAVEYLIPVEAYLSVQVLDDFFRKWLVYYITAEDGARRSFFLAEVGKYQRAASRMCDETRAHLVHFIKTKCLKSSGAVTFVDRVRWETPYMMKTLIAITQPYHHTLDVEMRDVTLKYVFHDPFKGTAGFRRVTQTGSDQQTVYDFLSLYTALETSDRIKAIIYKQGEDMRAKKADGSVNLREIPSVKQRDYTVVYLNSRRGAHGRGQRVQDQQSAQFLSQRQSGTTKHLTDPPHAIFDHRTTSCTITGTSEEIRELIEILNTATKQSTLQSVGLDLRDGEFISYKGDMELTTRAKLIKPLLQEIFLTEPFSRYFYPYTASSTSGNYVFVYTPDGIPVPREVNDYVSFLIEKEYEKTSVAAVWSVAFEGTSQAQILPFLSMFVALLQMLENVIYDERYQKFHEASQAYTRHMQSLKVQTSSTTIDSIISKKEVYLMLLRETGLTQEQTLVYSDRSRPVPVRISDENRHKWKRFFASVYAGVNGVVNTESTGYVIGGDNGLDMQDIDARYQEVYYNIEVDDVEEYRLGEFVIGMAYNGYTFFSYPEGGLLYPMLPLRERSPSAPAEIADVPIRLHKHIDREKSTELSGKLASSMRRSRCTTPRMRETIRMFTNETAEYVMFYRPEGEGVTYADHVNKCFLKRPSVLRAVLSQHLWDHSDEEIQSTLGSMNLFLHQDMLQNLEGALIFCFVETKNGYTFQIPRHNQWYAVDTNYRRAMFLFCGPNGKYVTVIFGSRTAGTIHTDINDRMRSFIRSSMSLRPGVSETLSASTLIRMMNEEQTGKTEIDGQFFDMNGKSIGIRVRSTQEVVDGRTRRLVKKVMDLRFDPQAPIMASREQTSSLRRFAYVNDVQTDVSEKFGKFAADYRFTLVPMPSTSVRYSISSIYEQSRTWKQRNYIFCRMVITHWLIFRETARRFFDKPDLPVWKTYPEEVIEILEMSKEMDLGDYASLFIHPYEETNTNRNGGARDPIMTMIILDTHDDYIQFDEYLSRIYQSVFYDSVFHVDETELSKVRSYMMRELDIIQTYPPEFYTHFVNMRLNMQLLEKRDSTIKLPDGASSAAAATNVAGVAATSAKGAAAATGATSTAGVVVSQMQLDPRELIGTERVEDDIRMTLVKRNRISNTYFMRVNRFNPMMDPLSSSKKSGKVEKAELIMTEVKGALYFIRLTREGHFEIACNICHAWKTQRQLLSYNETGTRDTTSRIFELRGDYIIERNDNNEAAIRTTGEDYHVLVYTRSLFISPKRQIAKVVYAAMLPLE
jgi:hypothetical protein